MGKLLKTKYLQSFKSAISGYDEYLYSNFLETARSVQRGWAKFG